MMSDHTHWTCKGCENFNCFHVQSCLKCSGKRIYLETTPTTPSSPSSVGLSSNIIINVDNNSTDDDDNHLIPLIEPMPMISSVSQVPHSSVRCDDIYARYNCNTCGVRFGTNNRLVMHIKKAHLNDLINKGLRVRCLHCLTTFDRKSTYALRKHIERKHPGVSSSSSSGPSIRALTVATVTEMNDNTPPLSPTSNGLKLQFYLRNNDLKKYVVPKTVIVANIINDLQISHGYFGNIYNDGRILDRNLTFFESGVRNRDTLHYI